MDSLELAKHASMVASDKKASEIVILDLKESTDLCDYMVVCSGANDRQTKAIASAIEDHFNSQFSLRPAAAEGKIGGHWILLDYDSIMVHVFFDYVRSFYAVEEIWPNAKIITAKANESEA